MKNSTYRFKKSNTKRIFQDDHGRQFCCGPLEKMLLSSLPRMPCFGGGYREAPGGNLGLFSVTWRRTIDRGMDGRLVVSVVDISSVSMIDCEPKLIIRLLLSI